MLCTGNLETNGLPAPTGIQKRQKGQITAGGNQEGQQNGMIQPRPHNFDDYSRF